MNSLIIIFLLLASIKSDSSGNLVLDFTLTYEQLVTKLNIGYGEKNITSYFQIDISSSNSWILNSVLNETYSSSFTNKGQKKDSISSNTWTIPEKYGIVYIVKKIINRAINQNP